MRTVTSKNLPIALIHSKHSSDRKASICTRLIFSTCGHWQTKGWHNIWERRKTILPREARKVPEKERTPCLRKECFQKNTHMLQRDRPGVVLGLQNLRGISHIQGLGLALLKHQHLTQLHLKRIAFQICKSGSSLRKAAGCGDTSLQIAVEESM